MREKVTIAIGGVGGPLGQSIMRAAMASRRNYRLIAMDVDLAARYVFPEAEFCQSVHFRDEHYLDKTAALLARQEVDLVFLGTEGEMLAVCRQRCELEKASGAKLAMSDEKALRIGMDKLLTTKLLQEAGMPFPRTIDICGTLKEVLGFAEEIGYPCMVKGRRAGPPFVANNAEDLKHHWHTYKGGVVQEFLGDEKSQEYTVGIFHTVKFGTTASYCMKRQLKYGLTWRGVYSPNPKVEAAAIKAIEKLAPDGSVNVQLREHNGCCVIHELNVRCSSTTVFRAMSGWNEIDMAVDYFIYDQRPIAPERIVSGTGVRFFQEHWAPSEP